MKEVVKVKERKLLKKQTFFSGAASLMIAGLYFCPDFPFDRKIHVICLFAALMYFSFFAFFESFKKRLNQIIFWMSVVGIVFLTCVIHFSGGIASPFTFIYFCIIISEYVYGGSGGLSLTAISASSYALMVLGEYAGFLDVSNDFTRSIYGSPLTTAYIVLFIVLFMFVVGDISRLIFLKLRLELKRESREKRSVEKKFLELSSYSQIGMFAHRIAHDVRGLVFAMKSHFQMFKPTSEEESRENKFMLENLDRVGDMINQVTKYGKPSEEKKEKIAVRDFLENMIKVSLLLDEAKNVCDKVILSDDFDAYAKDKKAIKKLASEFNYFIAQANIMPKVATAFGKVLGPKKKMPNPKAGCIVQPKASLKPLYDKLQKTIRVYAKETPLVQCVVGSEQMPDKEVADNILTVYTHLIHHLPNERNNIKSVLLKLTMSKPVEIKF